MEVLLDKEFCFHDGDSRTNRCVPLRVEREYAALEFRGSYAPKELSDEGRAYPLIREALERYVPEGERRGFEEQWRTRLPLDNLITLSIDHGGEYLGCAHRHAPEQRHVISGGKSSPGFRRSPAAPGDWRVVLNIHGVFTGEVVYHLRVAGLDDL